MGAVLHKDACLETGASKVTESAGCSWRGSAQVGWGGMSRALCWVLCLSIAVGLLIHPIFEQIKLQEMNPISGLDPVWSGCGFSKVTGSVCCSAALLHALNSTPF